MFHIYDQFKGEINYGFNFYPLKSDHSIGFYLKYWYNRSFHFRYSKKVNKFFFGHYIVDYDKLLGMYDIPKFNWFERNIMRAP